MQLEPLFGVWLNPDQIEALFDFYSGAGLVTITDLRDKSVELNLPPEIAGEISDFRGSVYVEQQHGDAGREGIARAAIIDRTGETYPLDLTQVRALTEDERLKQLVELASAVLREVNVRVDYLDTALADALDRWDDFAEAINSDREES